jgi:predicted metalloenzyme YecM
MEILGDYRDYMARVDTVLRESEILSSELTQCDTLVYEVETNERYEEVKSEIAEEAIIIAERPTNGRLVSIFMIDPSLQTDNWQISYIELLQPKPTRENKEQIDGVMCVTALPMNAFLKKHDTVPFDKKGLSNKLNPYVELKSEGISVKFHSKHMGSVIELENSQ